MDIKDFYPSISQTTLDNALLFAQNHTQYLLNSMLMDSVYPHSEDLPMVICQIGNKEQKLTVLIVNGKFLGSHKGRLLGHIYLIHI